MDEVKIDRSFVRDLDDRGDPIVDTTIDLAHRLGLEVVAEGIETPEGYQHLQRGGCDTGQGYLISRPISAAAVTAVTTRGRSGGATGGSAECLDGSGDDVAARRRLRSPMRWGRGCHDELLLVVGGARAVVLAQAWRAPLLT